MTLKINTFRKKLNYLEFVKMKPEKQLHKIWKKYINVQIYRVVSGKHYKDILKNGINPRKNPYEKIMPELKKLIKILERQEKKGDILKLDWGREVNGSFAMKVTLHDISIYAVDFTPHKEQLKYYLNLKGGAAVSNIEKITKMLLESEHKLSKTEERLVKKLSLFAKKCKCKNKAIFVRGSYECFETAYFQVFRKKKSKKKNKYKKPIHWQSPFGSFEHFKRVVAKKGLNKYLNKIKNKEFYLRVTEKIPAEEIKRLR